MLVFVSMFVIVFLQLINLQLFSSKYRIDADNQGTFRKVIYPDRGIVFDRKGRSILQNTVIYDLMVIPGKIKGTDTAAICSILNIDTAEFHKRIISAIIKNKSYRASIFEPLLSNEKMAKLNENMYKLAPGYFMQERSVRDYPFEAGGNIFGYLGEVDSNILKNPVYQGYVMGDYIGRAGLERTYEKVLMGQRGIEFWKRDNKNRLTDRLEDGNFDTAAIAGQNMYTSIDIELQALGEKLMENKLGSIVAVDPKTGGILAMVSSPTYKPKLLTGAERKKHFAELLLSPARPLFNRSVSATYSPGSTFKTLQALVGLQEGVITPEFSITCSGAFYGCGSGRPMKCLDFGTFDLLNAIRMSDNTYFATVMQKVITNPKYPSQDSALAVWDRYMYAFGLGHKLGIDVPSEKSGNIPTPAQFDKIYGKGAWNYCNFRSVSIGQGEVDVTPIQTANEMAYIANKGWYIIPHLVDSIEGGDQFNMLANFKEKHRAVNIPDSIFDIVQQGMQDVVDRGTGAGAKVPGIAICGKTGTVENYYKGVKQPNHAFFCGFAPRENPKIAIMCVVENSGRFGGTYAAPIVGLMIEKYLNDTLAANRTAIVEKFEKLNLIPPRIYAEMKTVDSMLHRKDSAYLIAKGYIKLVKETIEVDATTEQEIMDQLKKEKDDQKKKQQQKEESDNKIIIKPEAILPAEKKKPEVKDTAI
ncbi:MAG TPA: penicillin-binding transpeptidase domain-containing protein [Ferruginibacter sp.]|nr:penicillin-binding transpeptidase domain-containing protein [Ferruginibacter sp.]